MNFFRLLPVILSSYVLGAHFLRAGMLPLAIISALFPLILFHKRSWVARLTQVFLIFGALEWLRTLLSLITERSAMGQDWSRMAIILGSIALITGASALLFSYNHPLRERYALTKDKKDAAN